ncbi:DnaJ-domain-containing protein [Microthyrium microscopicum]|uniref:DnaJ-domain-containing protein n=1 Tax=Microthyrium microscopicum TaxID=703497 RepID=A0A6A6U857_9PEZI|nr:DnaJ-domain-containing protein [Microthyrium microscopicum]
MHPEPSTRDYYQDLELQKSATKTEIKRAFHRLAKIHHPDKNGPDASGDAFRKIREAFNVLKEDSTRSEYDSKHAKVKENMTEPTSWQKTTSQQATAQTQRGQSKKQKKARRRAQGMKAAAQAKQMRHDKKMERRRAAAKQKENHRSSAPSPEEERQRAAAIEAERLQRHQNIAMEEERQRQQLFEGLQLDNMPLATLQAQRQEHAVALQCERMMAHYRRTGYSVRANELQRRLMNLEAALHRRYAAMDETHNQGNYSTSSSIPYPGPQHWSAASW